MDSFYARISQSTLSYYENLEQHIIETEITKVTNFINKNVKQSSIKYIMNNKSTKLGKYLAWFFEQLGFKSYYSHCLDISWEEDKPNAHPYYKEIRSLHIYYNQSFNAILVEIENYARLGNWKYKLSHYTQEWIDRFIKMGFGINYDSDGLYVTWTPKVSPQFSFGNFDGDGIKIYYQNL